LGTHINELVSDGDMHVYYSMCISRAHEAGRPMVDIRSGTLLLGPKRGHACSSALTHQAIKRRASLSTDDLVELLKLMARDLIINMRAVLDFSQGKTRAIKP